MFYICSTHVKNIFRNFIHENFMTSFFATILKLSLYTNECPFINVLCTTIPGHFFAICVYIFHKTEVLLFILRCLMGLNLDWVKSYGLKYSLRHRASSASSQKIAIDKQPILDHIWPCLANYMFIFHKTEIPTVILRC